MTNLARKPTSHGGARLHFEESINADPLAVRDAIIEVMVSLQTELPPKSEGIVSTEIVLAEVLNNIVEHGYQASNLGSIVVSVICNNDIISVETRDYGVPMPGLTPPDPAQEALPVPVEDLPEGGFGWFFIRSLSSHMEYRRSGNQNIFCVQIPIDQDKAALK